MSRPLTEAECEKARECWQILFKILKRSFYRAHHATVELWAQPDGKLLTVVYDHGRIVGAARRRRRPDGALPTPLKEDLEREDPRLTEWFRSRWQQCECLFSSADWMKR